MPLTPEQIKALQAPLDPANVKKPSGSFGPKGDYIEGWHAINELNRVFGFDGWSYTIDLRQDDLREGKTSKGDPQWQAAYTCICTLTVAGVTRQDVGFGSGFAKGIGDAIEGATKEAATDALKRAARTFGNIFGLALYDKERTNVSSPPPAKREIDPDAPISDAARDKLAMLITASGSDIAAFCRANNLTTLKELTNARAAELAGPLKKAA